MKRPSMKTTGMVSTAALAVLEVIAHLRNIKAPLLDQAFIAAIGLLFAPKKRPDKDTDNDEA